MKKDTHNTESSGQSFQDQQNDITDFLLINHSYLIVEIS